MALAALLERRGMTSTIYERAPDFEHAGYMLGLYSLGSRVFHGLGLYEKFVNGSVPMDYYEVHDGEGDLIKRYSMAPVTERFGKIYTTTRPDLVKLLFSGLQSTPVHFSTAVETVRQRDGEVQVGLANGETVTCDLLVGADGIHSRVRRELFGDQPEFKTGWGGWVWWADPSTQETDTVAEFWGAGRFLGAYPTNRGVGLFAGAPLDGQYEKPGPGRADRIRERFAGMGERVDGFLADLPGDEADLFFWKLADVRSSGWIDGHVALMGDSAAGFLPTAGVGASMALESAAVLADELTRTDVDGLPHALALFAKRRRKRAETIQTDSRKLARMMFVKSATMAAIRDYATRFYSIESLARELARALDEPI